MSLRHKSLIDQVVVEAKRILEENNTAVEVIADNDDIYDVRIALQFTPPRGSDSPRQIAFSYDKDAGYFIDIDGYTLEFDEREQAFASEARKYLTAIHDDRVRIKPRRWYLPKFITLGRSIYLLEE